MSSISTQQPISGQSDIAIVGMACLLPGADSAGQFWTNITHCVDCVTDPPEDWKADRYWDPDRPANDRLRTVRGGYLHQRARFDPARFGVVPSAVDGAEPEQFLALRCAFEALQDAGYPTIPIERERTAVILGRGTYVNRGTLAWLTHAYVLDEVVGVVRQLDQRWDEAQLDELKAELKKRVPPFNADTVPGVINSIMVGRIANRLNLQGPAYTIDAACASSLLAVEHAVRDLRDGRVDAALAGGVQITPPMISLLLGNVGALSPTGKIAPFSAEANGMLPGEGCGVVVLKRRADAEHDGNRIYALIRGIGSSSDGKEFGLLAPRQQGQELAIRRAYDDARVSPSTVGLIEAHGTGVPLGDATEMRSVKSNFTERTPACPDVAMGSVKSMISHLIPASGIASLIKTALALHHRVLPPTLHAETPHPNLELDKTPFYFCANPRPWVHGDRDEPRRAGINAFGFGGANAHVVLEEYSSSTGARTQRFDSNWPVELVVVSAADRASLADRLETLAASIEPSTDSDLLSVAASLAAEKGPCRISIVAHSTEELAKKARHSARLLRDPKRHKIQDRDGVFWYDRPLAREGRVAFVIPGEGAQYPNMLRELCLHFPEVLHQFDLADAGFLQAGERLLSRLIFPLPADSGSKAQELLTLEGAVGAVGTAARALLALMRRFGVQADAVVGHSSGEFFALQAAGAYAPKDDDSLVNTIAFGAQIARRIVESRLVPASVLTAIGGADRAAVNQLIEESNGSLHVAMDNCPLQIVISGEEKATDTAIAALQGKGGICERLTWGRAYHTPRFAPACEILEEYYRGIGLQAPKLETWSCVTADRFPDDPEQVRELAVRQWRCPVRFRETIQRMHESGIRVFIEVGARGNLSKFIGDTLNGQPHAAVPLDVERRGSLEQLCHALGMLAAHGVDLRLEELYADRLPRRATVQDSAQPPAQVVQARLKLGAPELTLDAEYIKTVRGRWANGHLTNGDKQSARPAATPPTHNGSEMKKENHDGQRRLPSPATPVPHTNGNKRLAAQAPAMHRPVAARSLENGHRAPVAPVGAEEVLSEFQETMRSFLTVQHRVMTTALSSAPPMDLPTALNFSPDLPEFEIPSAVVVPPREEAPEIEAVAPLPMTAPPAAAVEQSAAELPPKQESPAALATPASTLLPAKADMLAARFIEILSERTGYPESVLSLDTQLESELGVDSIKRVEVIGAFRREALGEGQLAANLMEELTAASTARQIVDVILPHMTNGGAAASPPPVAPAKNAGAVKESAPAAKFAFIESVLEHEPGVRLVAECELDVERHHFLVDHVFFGRNMSLEHEGLHGLPIMPLAMTLELMAEAASILVPDLQIVALRNVQTKRWFAFDTATRRMRIEAEMGPDGVSVTALEADREGAASEIATAVLEFGTRPTSLGPPIVEDRSQAEGLWTPEELYGCCLFHGPAFRAITSIERSDMSGVAATVQVPDPAMYFTDGRPRRLMLPLSLIDNTGQAAGMPVLGRLERDDEMAHLTFPNSAERVEFLDLPAPGTELSLIVKISREARAIRYDAEMIDGAGNVVVRVVNRSDEIVDMPAGLYLYWSEPRAVALSADVSAWFSHVPGIEHCTVCRNHRTGGTFLVNRLWQSVLSRMILGPNERNRFRELKQAPVVGVNWLLGRISAKDAVRIRDRLDCCMADVAIENDDRGRPMSRVAGREGPLLSLAHKDFHAFAVAADRSRVRAIGIDFEPLEPAMNENVVADAFTAGERAPLSSAASAAGEQANAWLKAAWCAKEAVGKALGTGVTGGPGSVEIVHANATDRRIQVTLHGPLEQARASLGLKPHLDIWVTMMDGWVLALCLLPS